MSMKLEARHAQYAAWGKCDEIIKAKVPFQLRDAIQQRARLVGMTESEYIRNTLMIHLYGLEEVLSIEQQRLLLVAGEGHQKDTKE